MYNQEKVHTLFVALGSNLEPRLAYLRRGAAALDKLSVTPIEVSHVYETDPVGYVDQPRFLNLAARIQTLLSPLEILAELQRIEADCHRVRTVRFGPRTLDLDLLLYDDEYICFRNLQVPHPRMWERAFVLVPLADLIPERRGKGGLTIAQLAQIQRQKECIQDVGYLWPQA